MLFILDSKQRTVGIISNEIPKAMGFYSDVHTEAIANNLSTFEFEIPSNHPSSSLVEVEGFIIYTDLDNRKHLFVIKEINDSHADSMIKTVYCENSAVELIGDIVRPITLLSKTLEQSLAVVLNNTGWEIGDLANAGLRDIIFKDHLTSLEALHQVVDTYGVEMEFEVKFDGATVTKKLIHAVEKRGTNTGKIFEYGKDLTSVERIEDTRSLVTALIGVGKADANGNPLTFTTYNAPVDARYIKENDYVYDMDSFQRFNNGGKQIVGIFKDDKATNQVELFNNTLEKLKELSKPKLTFNCDVVTLERISGLSHESIRIGDQLVIKDWSFDIPLILQARIVELKRSKSDPSKDAVSLGDYVPIQFTQSDSLQKLQQTVFEKEQQWDSAKKLAEEIKDNIVYKVELDSSNGLIFKNGAIYSILTAKVYMGKDDITNTLLKNAFTWKKYDKDGVLDWIWSNAHVGIGKQITVTSDDIRSKATFTCDVDADLKL